FKDVSDLEGIDYFHNGGNHFLRGEGTLFNASEKGIGWITEPHDPHRWASYGDKDGRGWVLDWSTYIMLAQAGRGGANMHIYYWPLPGKNDLFLPAHYGLKYAYDRFEKWKPILREMHGVKFVQPVSEIAAIQDIYTMYCKHRGVFQQRLDDLKRWFELLKYDAVDFEYYSKERADKYKLIMPNILDEVMSDDNIKALGNSVRNGAKAVICATTGRSCPERKGKDFALLEELGISAPRNSYVITQPDVKATVVDDNAFWTKGQSVDFYSLSDMKSDIQSEEVKKAFGQWSYRWIPQTDYFGYFPGNKNTGGREIARFADGGTAISLHQCGKGEVLVFWGTPDYTPEKLKGFMANVAKWAGVTNPRTGSAIPLMLEGDHKDMKRHYAVMYQDMPGEYVQKITGVPDGRWFIDEIVSDRKMGVYTGEELRKNGIKLSYPDGSSPLKILRMIPEDQIQDWSKKYRHPEE
ncbi:MAG: hypothetical protein WAX69_23875, partial [Victivallales bacterium]